ncbi:MAG: hypothetical protein WA154_04960 [Moraxellaceae bacterium]
MPVFLDFEASSLASGSYPIEVAWGSSEDSIESHLISPAAISTWTDWSIVAQQLHCLTREQLLSEGQPPIWVARRMNEQLADQIVYTDNPDYDGFWLDQLFKRSAGLKAKFRLAHIDDLLLDLISTDTADRARAVDVLRAMKPMARQSVAGQHRASFDVQYLLKLHALVVD